MHAPDFELLVRLASLWYVIMIFLSNFELVYGKRHTTTTGHSMSVWCQRLTTNFDDIHEWWDHGIIESTFQWISVKWFEINSKMLFGKLLAFRFIDSKKKKQQKHEQCLCWCCILLCITFYRCTTEKKILSHSVTFDIDDQNARPTVTIVIAHAQHSTIRKLKHDPEQNWIQNKIKCTNIRSFYDHYFLHRIRLLSII